MSKARLVITAVVVEGRSQAEVARAYGVSPGWVSRLVARYRNEGDTAFEPRSRRPKTTLGQLQALLDVFVDHYNQRRPHRSLPHHATPAAAYSSRPKATPTSREADTHWRVRHDRVDATGKVTQRHNGRLHHIGIGRTHARTPITLLVADLDIRIINTTTGELLRHLTLDPTRNYQPTGRPPRPPPRKPPTP